VTPDQAEVLDLAGGQTKVQLVLRNPLDTKEEPTHGTTLASLFGPEIKQAQQPVFVRTQQQHLAAAVVPESNTVEVFSGVKKSEQKFELPH